MAGWRRCIQKLPPLPAGTLLALHPSLFLLLWEAAVFLFASYLIPHVVLGKQKGKV